jgi:hypothetical protein
MGFINIDTKQMVDEASAVIVPQLQKSIADAVTQIVTALKEVLPGLKITITIEKSSAAAEGGARMIPTSDTGTTHSL